MRLSKARKLIIDMLTYKAKLLGIKVIVTEESYTSKCSFLDLESISKHQTYLGKRQKRGLFRSLNDLLINADVNGAYNIIRKVVPNAFADGIEGIAVCPKWLLLAA
jgi:putative transposase